MDLRVRLPGYEYIYKVIKARKQSLFMPISAQLAGGGLSWPQLQGRSCTLSTATAVVLPCGGLRLPRFHVLDAIARTPIYNPAGHDYIDNVLFFISLSTELHESVLLLFEYKR